MGWRKAIQNFNDVVTTAVVRAIEDYTEAIDMAWGPGREEALRREGRAMEISGDQIIAEVKMGLPPRVGMEDVWRDCKDHLDTMEIKRFERKGLFTEEPEIIGRLKISQRCDNCGAPSDLPRLSRQQLPECEYCGMYHEGA